MQILETIGPIIDQLDIRLALNVFCQIHIIVSLYYYFCHFIIESDLCIACEVILKIIYYNIVLDITYLYHNLAG